MRILHDLKRIAVAINELTRDLDRIERDDSNVDACDIHTGGLGSNGQKST